MSHDMQMMSSLSRAALCCLLTKRPRHRLTMKGALAHVQGTALPVAMGLTILLSCVSAGTAPMAGAC